MGAVSSCCGRRPSKRRLHTDDGYRPKKRGHRRQISATFNASEFTMDQLDINQACEEELINLDGINRNVARNIIQYRNYIGGFRKVEDLALVSGVGALKLDSFRTEIYCGEFSYLPSRTQRPNLSRIPSWTRWSTYSKCSVDKIDINTASSDQIAQIRGIREEIAEDIVSYREKNGPFQVLSELTHLPSIGTYLFDRIRCFLTIGDVASASLSTASTPVSVNELQNDLFQASTTVSCATQTLAKKENTSACSCHCGASDDYKWKVNIEKDGRPVVRLASWNIGQCTLEKYHNVGVKEVLIRTILENGFGLIAVQDIWDPHVLSQLCFELNEVVESLGQNGNWRSVLSDPVYERMQGVEYLGFIWNADTLVLEDSSLLASSFKLPQNGTPLHWPFLGCFRVGQIEISVVNVHIALSSTSQQTSLLQRLWGGYTPVHVLSQSVSAELHDDENLIIVGDFASSPIEDDFDVLRHKGFRNLIGEYQFTDISLDNLKGTQCQSNMWSNHSASKFLTGNTGVCREKLTHPQIPNGWSLNGFISSQCPVWMDIYTAAAGGNSM